MVKKRWIPIGMLFLGFLLRLVRLGRGSIWYDEGVSLFLAQQSPEQLVWHTAGDIHPPFYYLSLHYWMSVAGNSEFAAAFFSTVFGVLIVAAVCRLATSFFQDETTGWAAGLIVALSPYNVRYSQEIRMYTLGAFLGLVSFWAAWRILEWQGRSRLHVSHCVMLLYVLSSALGLYTLYYFAFLLIAVNLWFCAVVFLDRRLDRSAGEMVRRWGVLQVTVLALYTPWLGVAIRQAIDPPVPPWRSLMPLWNIILESWNALTFGQSIAAAHIGYVLAPVAIVYMIGVTVGIRLNKRLGVGLTMYTFCPVAIIALVSLYTPLFHSRYVFTYSPAFYIVLAVGFVWLVRRQATLGAIAAAIWIGVSGYSLYAFHNNPLYYHDDFRAATRHIAEGVRAGDVILINAGYAYPAFVYYYPGRIAWRGRLTDYWPDSGDFSQHKAPVTLDGSDGVIVLQTGSINGPPSLGWGLPESDFYATDELETAQALERVFAAHPRVWLLRVYDTVVDPQGFVRSWLQQNGFLFDDRLFDGPSYLRVQGYLTQKQPTWSLPPNLKPCDAVFDGSLKLIGYQTVGDRIHLEKSRVWDIDLYWEALRRLPADYRVVIELADGHEQTWARSDEMPLGTSYPTSRWQPRQAIRHPARVSLSTLAPTGSYEIRVMVYDPRKQVLLDAIAPFHQTRQGRVTIGSVVVEN